MSSRTGQKRSAKSQAVETSNYHKTKKTRFVEPDEDPAYFEEQVETSLEQSSRRGKVKTDGYDSDSTDDGEGVVSSRKKGGVDKAEDLDDMFADPGESEVKDEGEKEKYMRLGDIEGQEFENDDMKSGSEYESEGEPEDEDDAEQRKKVGMGFELSSFNMREEMEEGKFTEDGSYIRTFDPNVVHDRWMDGISDKEIKLARRRKREQEKKVKEQLLAEEKELKESGGKSSIARDLLPFLRKGETVLEALQRLGLRSKKSLYVTQTIHSPHYLPIYAVERQILIFITMSKQLPILPLLLCHLVTPTSITKHMKNSSVVFGRPAS
jgi:CD2 antigen cytoplasmic tail-binding protein 2